MPLPRHSRAWGYLCSIFIGCGAGTGDLRQPEARPQYTKPDRVVENARPSPAPPPIAVAVAVAAAADEPAAGPTSENARRLLAAYPETSRAALSYTPSQASHFQCLQDSAFELDAEERATLDREGIVLSHQPRSFAMFYLEAFHADLPVFVSADAILHAWHRAYDELLVQVEQELFAPLLDRMLARMRQRLAHIPAKTDVKAGLDEYLAVAHSLLRDKPLAPSAGGSAELVQRSYAAAKSASGNRLELFGAMRETDLSQFKPRGHYESRPLLIPYFRAMMWLGRMDFRVFQSEPDGQQLFQRKQFEAMVLARQVMDATALAQWSAIDQGISVFVGMHDSATPHDVDALLARMKARDLQDVQQLSDLVLEDAVTSSDFGKQRILSDWQAKLPGAPTLPNNAAFALFGQRYGLDSHALHSVVEDRVQGRQMPQALDVGFSVFRNNTALRLLGAELDTTTLASALRSMRALSDAQTEAYWGSSFYSLWLAALRGMSPAETEKLPKSTRTDAWARRTLLTQLASWSELRHDTLLYAKPSYSTFILCGFPDAYVDPYPEVFARLAQSSELGLTLLKRMRGFGLDPKRIGQIRDYFTNSKRTFQMLERIARRELEHQRLTPEQLAFINRMIVAREVKEAGGCGGASVQYDGWYEQLFYTADIGDPDVTVADVHTSAEEGVLHVGKRLPFKAVISVDDGSGPRVFTGATYSFYQAVSSTRLSDLEWMDRPSADEQWLRPIVAHARR